LRAAQCILKSSRQAPSLFIKGSECVVISPKEIEKLRRECIYFAMAALCAKSGEHQGLSRSRAPRRRRGPAPSPPPQSKGLGVSEPMRTGPASTRRARSRVQPWEDAHRLTPARSSKDALAAAV